MCMWIWYLYVFGDGEEHTKVTDDLHEGSIESLYKEVKEHGGKGLALSESIAMPMDTRWWLVKTITKVPKK